MEALILVGGLIAVLIVSYLILHRRSLCPTCGRARVPGRTECPWCHTLYVTKSITPPTGTSALVCIQGPHQGQRFPIVSSNFTIGRSPDNSLAEEGVLVSRHHAEIAVERGQYVLYDRDSTNGTWVNGRRVAHHILSSDDQIQIGPSIFVFQMAGAAAPPSGASTPPKVARVATPAPPERRHEFEDYQLLQTLGGGGAATVYRAVSRQDGTTVAIKILHQADPYLVEKFEQEGRLKSILQHPHIVAIYDFGRSDGNYYIIMEYLSGGSLRQRLTNARPVALDFALSTVGQTCEALAYAHNQGVIHRDIKPENILFSAQQEVKVVDFGIAKLASAPKHTSDGMILGTPYYMSYEQAKGDTVYPQSDIYSLGVVLYELTTGRVPFLGDPLTVVHKHLTEEPVSPRQLNPALPAHVESVIRRAMAKDYRRRFSSAQEMSRALGYAPGQQPPRRREQERLVPPAPRRVAAPPAAGTGGACLVVVATGRVITLTGEMLLVRKTVDPADTLISREQHARIFRQGEQFWLVDSNSTNGTYLNGQRIFDQALLQSGDEIRIGRAVLRFERTSGRI
jgi:pSer/pThr/pTyr-binding forkhead associated (FHA) protein